MELPLPRLVGAELVIGIVGRMGVDTREVAKQIEATLKDFAYRSYIVQVSEHVREIRGLPPLTEEPIEERYATRINACNALRALSGRNDILAFTSIIEIRGHRKRCGAPEGGYIRNVAYIINQLKRVEEVLLLRQVYGSQFIQISCHAKRERQLSVLVRKIRRDHLSVGNEQETDQIANALIDRDSSEEDVPHGQRVREAFPLADLVINAENSDSMEDSLNRFFAALFGDFKVSPTRQEYGMNLANVAALRSIDPSRQVGAAILSQEGEVLALGCNEVPKFEGGTYWYKDTPDGRDVFRGQDENAVRKRAFLFDVVRSLREARKLSQDLMSLNDNELVATLIDGDHAVLAKSPILDLLEFNRNLHAEMNAITDAARLGISLKGATMYTTTFPCHNCAKHIVGAGLKQVFYLQPYPKSQAKNLFEDSICVSGVAQDKVLFRQFIGLTPRRFRALFEKEKLKDDKGVIRDWQASQASPLIEAVSPVYLSVENWAITHITGTLKEEVRSQLLSGIKSEIVPAA